MNIIKLINKYRDLILYGIFGVLTTVVNIVVYWLLARVCAMGTMTSTLIAWIAAVLFAYITNRKWVFHSSASTLKEYVREIISFFSCRIATGLVDWGCMFVFVDLLCVNDLFVKAAANILVIILNYIASKFVIFKTGKGS
ncbi:MAG: GtrA family protein [Oscillospiraceae bacterium]